MEHEVAETRPTEGDLSATSFAQVVMELFEAAETGTLYLQDARGAQLAAIRIEAGAPVRARMAAAAGGNLLQALVPLCARALGSFAFATGQDGVGAGSDVLIGRVDPRALIAAAGRGPLREDAVAEVMVAVGGNLLKLNPRADLARYAFSPEERKLIDALSDGPIDFAELAVRTEAPEPVLRRFMYVLRVTHALTILPAARRSESGTVEHVEPPFPVGKSVARAGSYSMREPEHGTTTLHDADAGLDVVIDVEAEQAAPARGRELKSVLTAQAQAKSHQARAEALLERADYAEALREASAALKLGGSNAECQALYAWALYQHNGGGERVHPRVWDHLEHAIKRDPLCERAHLYKARLLKRLGRFDAAHWHFRRVAQIDRNNLEAAREVRLHDMRKRHLQPSGLVRRLLDRLK